MQLSGLKCGHFLRGHQEALEGPLRVSRNITFFCHGERYARPSFRQCHCDHLVSARHWQDHTSETGYRGKEQRGSKA